MITLTERAANQRLEFPCQARQGGGFAPGRAHLGLLGHGLQARVRGCRQSDDHTFESHGVKVVVDPKSLQFLEGTELDFTREGLNEGFKFNNPNVKDECGCGESFKRLIPSL